jgi:eukaryotic-like serine/threonine-protein kinase
MVAMHNLEGTLIDHYYIGDRIAKGGMAEIYLAQDVDTQQTVALKLVHRSNFEYCERFQHEIQTIAALTHPHIIPALAYSTNEAWCYLVTPYFADGTLDKQLSQGPLTLHEAGDLLTQLGSALQFAHDHGVLHRDIKPSNVLMRDKDYVYLADFGLARQMNSDSGITASEYLIGTAEYMAPELAEEKASVSSDIYALGVLLYQLLTSRVPFKGQTPIATFLKQMSEEVTPPSSFNPTIPPAIEQVILRALEKKPRKRYKTVQDFVDAYHSALQLAETPIITIIPIAESISLGQTSTERIARVRLARTQRTLSPPRLLNSTPIAQRPLIPLLVATLALFVSLLAGVTLYSPSLEDNGNASSLSSVNAVTTIPTKSKKLTTLSLKGETSGPTIGQAKSALISHPAQFLDANLPDLDQSHNNQLSSQPEADQKDKTKGHPYRNGHHNNHKSHLH